MTSNDAAINKQYYKIHKVGDAYFIALDPALVDNITDSFIEVRNSEGILLRRARKDQTQ